MIQRILLVDDNIDCRELMALYIHRLGYDVVQAGDGIEAIEKAEGERFDLILMDIQLPKLGGAESVSQLKKNSITKEVPILIFTGFSPNKYENTPLASDTVDIIQKPISLQVVRHLLKKYLPPIDDCLKVAS